jgi:hypothetical protein
MNTDKTMGDMLNEIKGLKERVYKLENKRHKLYDKVIEPKYRRSAGLGYNCCIADYNNEMNIFLNCKMGVSDIFGCGFEEIQHKEIDPIEARKQIDKWMEDQAKWLNEEAKTDMTGIKRETHIKYKTIVNKDKVCKQIRALNIL